MKKLLLAILFAPTLMLLGLMLIPTETHAVTQNWSADADFGWALDWAGPWETKPGWGVSGTIDAPASVASGEIYSVTVTQRLDASQNLACYDFSGDGQGCDSGDSTTWLEHNGGAGMYLPAHTGTKTTTFTAKASGSENLDIITKIGASGGVDSPGLPFINIYSVTVPFTIPITAGTPYTLCGLVFGPSTGCDAPPPVGDTFSTLALCQSALSSTLGGRPNNCVPPLSCQVGACMAVPTVNGSCALTHNNCIRGTSANTSEDASNYYWQCLGSGPSHTDALNCSETKSVTPVNGSCNNSVIGGCSSGTVRPGTPVEQIYSIWQWYCDGSGTGSNSPLCEYVACGAANGTTVATAPTTNLCSNGIPSAVAGTGPWTWTCEGSAASGIVKNCSANKSATAVVNGSCGVAQDSCNLGTWSDRVDTATTYEWSCLGSGTGHIDATTCNSPKIVSCTPVWSGCGGYWYNNACVFSCPVGTIPGTTVGPNDSQYCGQQYNTCIPSGGAVCGNNIVEAGEQCDPPNAGLFCSATCQYVGTAGRCSIPARHYQCLSGNSTSPGETATRWTWTCMPSGIGTMQTCIELKPQKFVVCPANRITINAFSTQQYNAYYNPTPGSLNMDCSNISIAGTVNVTNDANTNWTSTQPSIARVSNISGTKGLAEGYLGGNTRITATYREPLTGTSLTDYSDLVVNAPSANNARCVGINAPSSTTPGATFSADVTLRNIGSNTFTIPWYNLGSRNNQNNLRWGLNRVSLPGGVPVAPGGQVTFTFNATAPVALNTYDFDWSMVQDGVEWFGETCRKRIAVAAVPPPVPSATINAPDCTIVAGNSSCSSNVTWSTANAPTVSIRQDGAEFSTAASSSGTSRVLAHGPHTFTVMFGGPLATDNATAACAAGSSWNGTICAGVPPPAPVLSLVASPTTINVGGSSVLTWTVTGATTCFANGGWNGWKAANDGSHTENVSPVVTTTYTLECWNAGVSSGIKSATVTVNPVAGAIGDINATNCTIPTNGNSCQTTVSWSSNLTTSPNVQKDGALFMNGASNLGVANTITYGSHSFVLRDGASVLDTASPQASCGGTDVWNAGANRCEAGGSGSCSPETKDHCVLPAQVCEAGYVGACNYTCNGSSWGAPSSNTCVKGNITATTPVNTGNPSNVSWTSTFASACSVTSIPVGAVPAGWNTLSNTGAPSNALTANTTFTLSCRGSLAPAASPLLPVDFAIVTVNTAPTLTTSKKVVSPNESFDLIWDTNNGDESLCTLTGGSVNLNPIPLSGLGSETGQTSTSITTRTTFTLTCGVFTVSKTVDIKATEHET